MPVPFDMLYTRVSLPSVGNVTKFLCQLGTLLLQEDPISIRSGSKISSPAKQITGNLRRFLRDSVCFVLYTKIVLKML